MVICKKYKMSSFQVTRIFKLKKYGFYEVAFIVVVHNILSVKLIILSILHQLLIEVIK